MGQDRRDRTPDDVVVWFEEQFGEAKAYGRENCRRIKAHDERIAP